MKTLKIEICIPINDTDTPNKQGLCDRIAEVLADSLNNLTFENEENEHETVANSLGVSDCNCLIELGEAVSEVYFD